MSKYIKEGEVAERMAELMEPVNKQVLMCDNREDVLMLACAMLTLVRSIFDQELGEDGRKKCLRT